MTGSFSFASANEPRSIITDQAIDPQSGAVRRSSYGGVRKITLRRTQTLTSVLLLNIAYVAAIISVICFFMLLDLKYIDPVGLYLKEPHPARYHLSADDIEVRPRYLDIFSIKTLFRDNNVTSSILGIEAVPLLAHDIIDDNSCLKSFTDQSHRLDYKDVEECK